MRYQAREQAGAQVDLVGLEAGLQISPLGIRQQKEVQEKADLRRSEGGVGKYSATEAKEGSGCQQQPSAEGGWEGQRPRRGRV